LVVLQKDHKLNEVKDYESEIKKLPNRDECEDVTPFEDGVDGKAVKTTGENGKKAKKIADILASIKKK